MSSAVPAGWEVTKLGEHTNRFYQGINTVADKVVYQIDGIPILQAKHITSGVITFGGAKFLDVETYRKYREKFQPQESDILFTNIGTIGKSVLVQKPSKYLIAWNIFLIGLKVETNPKYFNLFLQKLDSDQYFEDLMTGNATKFINKSNLYDIPFLTPPLPEQKKIASILTSVDEVIENTQKQIDKLQDLKKATMNELLTKGIGHAEFKDSELGRIPKSWEVYSVQELLDNGTLLTMKDGNHGAQYPRSSEFQRSGVPFLAASSISEEGAFEIDQLPCLSSERAKSLRIPCAIGGDVILTHNATVGRVTIIPQDVKEIIVSTSTTYYRVNGKSMSNEYLKCFLEGNPFQSQLQRVMGQTTRNQVPITAQRLLSIALPPTLDEQMHISQVISSLSQKLVTNAIKLQKTQSLKKSLMQDLLTGKVRVTVN